MALPFDMEKQKSDALTELLHRYLEFLYQQYLKKSRNKPWMREGDLDKLLEGPYSNYTLHTLLCDPHTVTRGLPNILIIQGEKGDGRRFSITKMIETCYENIHHLGWKEISEKKVAIRFPIYVPKITADKFMGCNLIDLAYKCLIDQMNLGTKEHKNAQALISGLGRMGKLVVFFEEETGNEFLLNNLSIRKQEYQPIAVFTELPDYERMQRNDIYYIRMEPLTISQIAQYLTAELPDLYSLRETEHMLQGQNEVAAILSKPEWLQLHTEVVREDARLKNITTVNRIYDAFLSAQINAAYNGQKVKLLSRENLELWLIQRAKGDPIQDEDEQYRACFQKTSIFRECPTEFRFEGCKDYLIAKEYANAIRPKTKVKTVQKILEKILNKQDLMVLKFFAGLYTTKSKRENILFKQLLHLLTNNLQIMERYKDPSSILADVLIFTNRVTVDGPEFVKWACREMEKSKYDTAVLEAITRLNQTNSDGAIAIQLTEQYKATTNERVKRRIAYCFGYMGQDYFPEILIDDLCAASTALHLRYHISAALVDNCENIISNVREHFSDLEVALSSNTDPILRSDFDTLFTRIGDAEGQQYRNIQNECENQLIKLLENGEYWEKAHAAGALGRRSYKTRRLGLQSVITKLLKALDVALEGLYQSDDGNELKTISYIVEACCKLAENNQCDDVVVSELQPRLLLHLSELPSKGISISVYNYMQIALKLLDAGLLYLQKDTSSISIRTTLGLCFSSKESIIQFLSRHHSREQQRNWPDLNDAISAIKQWSSWEGAKRELTSIYQEAEQLKGKDCFSLACLCDNNEIRAMGFLFYCLNSIYFITCRHCLVQKVNGQLSLSPFLENANQISVFPICLGGTKCYQGTICYPINVCGEQSFDDRAENDMVIYRLRDIPASFAQVIFSENDVPPDWEEIARKQLDAFAYPLSRVPGKKISCKEYEVGIHGFFTVNTIKPISQQEASGFSGVPVIHKLSDNIVGMWKSSKDGGKGATEVCGIKIQTIIDKINLFAKREGDYCE